MSYQITFGLFVWGNNKGNKKKEGQKEVQQSNRKQRKSTANKSQTQSLTAARKCTISIAIFISISMPSENTHPLYFPPTPRGVFSCCCRWQFSFGSAALGFFSFCLFFGRVRARKLGKYCFACFSPDFFFFFYFFYLFSFFFKHQISGFQFQCRFKVAACYLVGGKWAGYVTRRATMKTGQRQEAEKITEIPPLWPHRKLWLFKDPNSFDLQRKTPDFSYSRYWNKSQSKLNINKYIIKTSKNHSPRLLDNPSSAWGSAREMKICTQQIGCFRDCTLYLDIIKIF